MHINKFLLDSLKISKQFTKIFITLLLIVSPSLSVFPITNVEAVTPTISGLSVNSGLTTGGTQVTITGTNFSTLASGGVITYVSGYAIHTFTSGSSSFVTPITRTVEVLVIGGGGGGGHYLGGGGGAGGRILNSSYSASGTISAIVGAGGSSAGPSGGAAGGNGGNSTFGSLVSIGGGGGGGINSRTGLNGGSGGGGSINGVGGTATATQGYNGSTSSGAGAGGGGVSSSGTASSSNYGGNGGIGFNSAISGISTNYCGGGGGGGVNGGGTGSSGAGSGGYSSSCAGGNGTANTGGGGGGSGGGTCVSGSGGSGVIIVKYAYTPVNVTFGGTAATNIIVNSPTSLTVTTPIHTAGAVNVVVTNTDGSSSTLTNGFTYNNPAPPPTISSISQSYGVIAGGTSVNITGTNFLNEYAQATGGIITYTDSNGLNPRSTPSYPGGFTVHTFTSIGSSNFVNPTARNVEVLAIGAGGGANCGVSGSYWGSGGAGGVVRYSNSYSLTSGQTVSVSVGSGGAGSCLPGTGGTGGTSSFGTLSATGGQGNINTQEKGGNNADYIGGTGSGTWGGGGAGAGGNGGGDTTGLGGIGYASSISGVLTKYGGGGAGSPYGTAEAGGGNSNLSTGQSGTPNTGGGGAGGGYDGNHEGAGAGGSGVVIVRYPTLPILVTFGGVVATNVVVNSSTSITATIPANSAGTVDVVVSNSPGYTGTLTGGFTYDGTAPSTPSIMTTSDENAGEIIGAFTTNIPSGSTDTGGSGVASYSLWKCDDEALTINCIVIQSGITGTTVTVSAPYLPSEDNTIYYYWTSVDNAGNTSNKSEAKAITMNAILPPTLTDTPTPTLTPTTGVTLTPVPGGTTIQGVAPEIQPVLITDWNTNLETTAQTGNILVGVEDTVNANIKVAELDVDFNSSPNWSGVTGATAENLAFFHSTNPISTITNGAASSYSLYIRKGEGDKVWICPGATSLSEVTLSCANGYFLAEGETKNGATATVITNGVEYWKVSGLTGTGGMSVLTGLRDTLSRLQVLTPSDHKITFGTSYGMISGSTDSMILSFPNFDLTGLTISDIELTDNVGTTRTLASLPSANTWGVIIDSGAKTITFSVPTSGTGGFPAPGQIAIKIGLNAGGTNQITNPSSVGNTSITITLNNTDPGEMGLVNIPIVDSDQVEVTGYVTAYIHFDIDTATGEVPGVDAVIDCDYDICQTHENGNPGLNYTVDLGELTSAVVNKSNSTSVDHTEGGTGIINSIYFDITTNAPSGAVVTVKSANGGLQGPGTNKIPSIGVSIGADGVTRSDGDDIPANSGVYGFNLPVSSSQLHGSIVPNSLCDNSIKFCGAETITPKTVFTTNNLPVDTARVRMDLAAAANYTNNPGLYTDTLTFIATATF